VTQRALEEQESQSPTSGQRNIGEGDQSAPQALDGPYSQFSLDRKGRFIDASDELLAQSIGYRSTELIGQHYSTLLVEGQETRVRSWFARVLEGQTVGPVEVKTLRRSGDHIWVRFTAMPRLEGDEVVGIDCIAQDVTAEVHARAELPRLKQLHESIVDSIRVGIVVVDAEHTIVGWNRHMEEWFQMARRNAIGHPVTELFPKLAGEGLESWIKATIEGGEPFSMPRWCHESERRHAVYYIDASVVPLRAPDDDVIGALLLFEDVSHEVALEEELRRSEQLTTIAQTAAAVNHEINNPLAAVLGNAELLLRHCSDESPTTARRLRRIAEGAGRIAEVTQKLVRVTDPVVTEWAPGHTMLDIERSASERK
jgi:PAS domain S-box-containing protein